MKFIKYLLLVAVVVSCKNKAASKEAKTETKAPLNILLITADDLNKNSVGVFGSKVEDITPNIDKLASEGVVFERGHVNVAVCQPSRGILATGKYAHNSGIEGFFHTKKDIPTIVSTLKANNYYCGILGKVGHSSPKKNTPWDFKLDMPDLGMGRNKDIYYKQAKQIIQNAKKEGKPFYIMANSHDPHRPFAFTESEEKWLANGNDILKPSRIYKEEEVTIPGFLPELPLVRKEVTQYFNSVRRLDDTVGKILEILEQEGQADNTLVMFLSDNGMAFPFAKTNCYLQSTNTPWIVRWPGKVKPNTRNTNDFISGVDFFPTVLEAIGIDKPEGLDGNSFLPVLLGKSQEGRDEVYTQFFETSAKKIFPMRCVQDAKYGYIFNAWSNGVTEFKNESQSGYTYKAMVEAAKTNPEIAARVTLFDKRVVEEFYDFENDPNALNNLIDNPEYKELIDAKRAKMQAWMEKTNDPALELFLVKDDNEKLKEIVLKQQAIVTKLRGKKKNKNKHH